ncbi:FAD-dependent oxidoreductase [Cytobacillus sp. OWB-43]|uniref:NAD(P)/FAD-dependent oxidoreductase n=1 Tax=Cytobacillus sp. OWB-43 TaxID=3108468 RepID=UPI002AFF8CC3|nr:FAD-dependent oxidoreductase [Cytobacillus sp. OWB-43]MEA1852599.1 FAD-dependent oxidoreductase [Cytobacillus sp. OWB-43]
MNLKTGKLYWPITMNNVKKYGSLQENKKCDVCIIGSGSSGAFLAYQLAKENIRTIVIDKRKIGMGSSSANTGLLQFSNDKSFTSYINSFGIRKAKMHLQNCFRSISNYENTILPTLEDNPDFLKRKSLYFASKSEDITMLKKEFANLQAHQFPVRFLSRRDMRDGWSFEKEGAIVTEGDAEINIFKNVHYLLSAASKKGVDVFEESEIVGQKWGKNTVELYTDNKNVIETKYVIYATGYEAQSDIAEKNGMIVSSYALATNPVDYQWPEDMLIWETARPYLYLRRTLDKRIIIGGLDEKTSDSKKRDGMLVQKRDQLLKQLFLLFPTLEGKLEPAYYWTGFFGETHNGLPMIKRHPNYSNAYYLLTYGGNGTVYSMILSDLMKKFIVNGDSNGMELYYH